MVDNTFMDSIRIDKWLWAARFFKTRALASKACDLGRILSNDHEAKPSREVHVGDKLEVKNEGGDFQIEVLALSQMRGPATMAQTLYRESEASKEARAKAAAERKAMQEFAPLPEHRPTKRDRRRIIQFAAGEAVRLSLSPVSHASCAVATRGIGISSVSAIPARINNAPLAGRSPSRSPVTTNDVIQAKTGSIVSSSAMCVGGSTACAQL